jgi:hypothetical protein
MVENIRKLQELVKVLLDLLRKIKSKQVYQKSITQQTKDMVDNYFRNMRDPITNNINKSYITILDDKMQKLLAATHKNTTVNTYKKILSNLKKHLIEVEKIMLLPSNNISHSKYYWDDKDKIIINTLQKIIPSAALSYKQALTDMQMSERLSWRGPATDFREALRECLDYLAPDKEVMSSTVFKLETDMKNPTMKQKAVYIFNTRNLSKSIIKTSQESIDIIEQCLASFVRSVYTRASVSTHTPTNRLEVNRIHDLVKVVLCELLSIN